MKKIILSLIALVAMVGMANAQRVWAYDLNLTSDGSLYTLTFKATTEATEANLVFTDAEGNVEKVALQNVVAGANSVTLSDAEIPGAGTLNWAVELTAAPITEAVKVTDDAENGGFWFPNGVGANINPESDHFGKIYVANPRHSTKPEQTGFYQMTPDMAWDKSLYVDGSKVGYKPSNLTLANAVDAIQRMAVNPVDGTVAFVQWNAAPFAVYGLNPDNLAGEATNLSTGINQPVAVCYDQKGVMYVLSYDGKVEGVSAYGIYSVTEEGATQLYTNTGWTLGGYCELATDGHGGFWVMNGVLNASNVVTAANLKHITSAGVIDIDVNQGTETLDLPVNFYRLRLAYDLKRDVLAIGGGGKVTLYNVTYNEETGAAQMVKWTETPMMNSAKPAWCVDGIAFDYAGDLLVVSASSEVFYKYALPTTNNTCITPAKKAQVIEKEEAIEAMPLEMTNLVVTPLEGGAVMLEASNDLYGVAVTLAVMADGTVDPSSVVDFYGECPVISGNITKTYSESLKTDVYEGIVIFDMMGSKLALELTMYSLPAIDVEITAAVASVLPEGALQLLGNWGELPVSVKVAGYEEAASKEYEGPQVGEFEILTEDENADFGAANIVLVTKEGNNVTVEGVFSSYNTGKKYNVTISGAFAAVEAGVENLDTTVAPAKVMVNGQLVIIKDGVNYNAVGTIVK